MNTFCSTPGIESLTDLLPALHRLDRLLEAAIQQVAAENGDEGNVDPYRGLYVSREEMEQHLRHAPAAPRLHVAGDGPDDDAIASGSRLAWLRDCFDLSRFELDLLLLAIAPELDRRYERLYAYLQDHVNRVRPTVDLALHLFCSDAAARIEQRRRFDPDAPLLRHGLVHLVAEPSQAHPSLLAYSLWPDAQIVNFLLGHDAVDRRLSPFCQLVGEGGERGDVPVELLIGDETQASLYAMSADALKEERPLRLYFQGPPGAGKRTTAAALAAMLQRSLLVVEIAKIAPGEGDANPAKLAETLRLALRHATLYGALLYVEGMDEVGRNAQRLLRQAEGVTILSGVEPRTGMVTIPFAMPSTSQQQRIWQHYARCLGLEVDEDDLDALTARFRLWPGQIAEAADRVKSMTSRHAPHRADLFAAARAQSTHDLDKLARKVEPLYRWHDLVLPPDTLAHLVEIKDRVAQRSYVLDTWGFERKLSLGKGVNTLFSGPSGTGKTMAAEIIAGDLGLDLYKIDLSSVVSKYIGETEKNLERIFSAAEHANAILFFDEADALFGKRSEVHDAHDRYANLEVSYLLQRMESYEGLAILATNLRQNLDPALMRRMAFAVDFPFPDEESRRRIWAGIWPAQTPLAADLDLDFLAARFKLSGGNIKNVALAAAFLAATEKCGVSMRHIRHALRREYQKMGKILDAELIENGSHP